MYRFRNSSIQSDVSVASVEVNANGSSGKLHRWKRRMDRRARGSVLLFVLGIVALAGFILVEFIEEATDEIKYYGLFYNRDDLRVEAFSWLDTTLAVINEIQLIDRTLKSPIQGWRNEQDIMRYASIEPPEDYTVTIKVEDESGKFGLDALTQEVLEAIFQVMEIEFMDQRVLIDSFLDWLDEDNDDARFNGAEDDYYDRDKPGYRAANGPIKSWEELRLIRGFDKIFFDEETGEPTEYFSKFKEMVSLYNKGPVNMNTANGPVSEVLAQLEGFNPRRIGEFMNGFDGERGTEDDRMIDAPNSPFNPSGSRFAGAEMGTLKISITIKQGESSYLLTTLVDRGAGGGTQPQNNAERNGENNGGPTDNPNGEQGGQQGQIPLPGENGQPGLAITGDGALANPNGQQSLPGNSVLGEGNIKDVTIYAGEDNTGKLNYPFRIVGTAENLKL